MRIYIIGNDGITLCREPPATVNKGEVAVASREELHAARLSGKRLLALWNALPGVEKQTKAGDRDALIDRLWSAIEALPDPDQPSDTKRPSKQQAADVRRDSSVIFRTVFGGLVKLAETGAPVGSPEEDPRSDGRADGPHGARDGRAAARVQIALGFLWRYGAQPGSRLGLPFQPDRQSPAQRLSRTQPPGNPHRIQSHCRSDVVGGKRLRGIGRARLLGLR